MDKCRKCKKEIPDNSIFCNICGAKQVLSQKKRKQKSANGMGTVTFLAGRAKPWLARAPAIKNSENKIVRPTIGYYATSKEAHFALESIRKKSVGEIINYTLAEVYELWKEPHFKTIGYKGQKGYEASYKYLAPLWNEKMRTLRTEDFQNIINSNADKYSLSQLQKINQLCRQLCSWAAQNDLMDKNYAEYIKLPKEQREEKRIFTDEEIQSIEKMVDDKRLGETAKITMSLLYTGMRISELLQMRSEDVNIFEGYMIGGNKTKAGKRRKIPIHSKIKPYIISWLAKGNQWLIPSELGNARSSDTVRKGFNSLMGKLAIVGVTPHSCRHTYISRALAAGMHKDVLQAIVGHAGDESTETYIHVGIEQVIAAGGLIV